TTQVRAGAVVNAGVATREMTVRYTNNIGMSYTHRMDGVNLSVGGAAQAEIGRHGVHGAGLGVSVDHDAEESRSEPLHPGYFWAPDWFDGRYASGNTQVGAAGSAAAGNSGANVGGSVGMGQMTFSHGTNDITFFFPPGASGSQGGSRGTGAQHNNVTVGATVDVGVGRALGRGTTGDQPPPPDNPHHLVKQPELTLLLRTRIDFATQSDAIDGVGRNEVEETVRRVREFVQQHPDTDLETSIRSSASRRWRGAETPEQAAELNMVLSQNRAERARVELRGAIERIIGAAPTPHGRYGDEVSVQAMGSEEAALTNAGPDDDSQDFRWVDIEIRRSVYREGEPENPR
ncbi:MAG TPA: hypothetical protein VFF06_36540, partial [Polyangia bacterium]|nr:hypothetical protein [Polyangia bacterium]